jgi:hypothetical protein
LGLAGFVWFGQFVATAKTKPENPSLVPTIKKE